MSAPPPPPPPPACTPSSNTTSSEILLNPTNAQIALAFGLALAAAGSTCLGAATVWVANLANPLLLAAALGASAGVMVYVSLVEIVHKAVAAFQAAGSSPGEAYRWATLAFFGGVAAIWLVDRFVLTRFVAWAGRRARDKRREREEEEEQGRRQQQEPAEAQPPSPPIPPPVGAAAASVAAAAARDLAQLPPDEAARRGGGGVCRGGRADDDEDDDGGGQEEDGGEAKEGVDALGAALARIRGGGGCCDHHHHHHEHDKRTAAATETTSTAVAAAALAARPRRRIVALWPFAAASQRRRRTATTATTDVEGGTDASTPNPLNNNNTTPTSTTAAIDTGPSAEELGRIGLTAGLALAAHNAPEGLATFVGALASPSTGFAVAIAIILHNLPEGMVVALPVAYATRSRWRGFLWGCVPAIAEPLGALVGWGIVRSSGGGAAGGGSQALVYGLMFGGVAGIMTFLSVHELLPAALRNDPRDKVATMSFLLGAAVIAASLLLFQA